MMIIGVDYRPSFRQFVEVSGECGERRLNHSEGEAENFYRELKQRGINVRVGMETTGYSRWFERLLAELGFEVWNRGINCRAGAKKQPALLEITDYPKHSGKAADIAQTECRQDKVALNASCSFQV